MGFLGLRKDLGYTGSTLIYDDSIFMFLVLAIVEASIYTMSP